ncbi:hypothetical protein BKA56DRAFT_669965 [Ilyonectria sp. MPI-CAGE-AT-0026]|nr:hypothetical protein BKA56DRAFT_669965 [Ilyonectria sp. MPI-CAGE-AT-0026]
MIIAAASAVAAASFQRLRSNLLTSRLRGDMCYEVTIRMCAQCLLVQSPSRTIKAVSKVQSSISPQPVMGTPQTRTHWAAIASLEERQDYAARRTEIVHRSPDVPCRYSPVLRFGIPSP